MAHPEKLIRITTLLPRKKGLSQADFYKHWKEKHAPLVLDFMNRHGIVGYRQVHTTPEAKAQADDLAKALGRPLLEYDGVTDAFVKDVATLLEAFKDPEYLEVIRPDELSFIDVVNVQMTIGYEYVIIEDGKPMIDS